MKQITIVIEHPAGLHLRPLAQWVDTAKKFQSKITLTRGARTVDGKSPLMILSLGVTQGTEVTVTANGPDEDPAVAALQSLVESNFETAP
ncbi:MAG: HPr family phosphocarrier protein [Rudaea sp.]